MADPPLPNATAIGYLRTLHDFIARSPDELSLKKNSKIELLEKDEEYNDGWYLVRFGFLRDYVLVPGFCGCLFV